MMQHKHSQNNTIRTGPPSVFQQGVEPSTLHQIRAAASCRTSQTCCWCFGLIGVVVVVVAVVVVMSLQLIG